MFQEKNDEEISTALKRFFPRDKVRLIALFVSQKASDLGCSVFTID